MKDKIIMLVIGILIGAIITSGCFLLFNKGAADGRMNGGERPDMGNFVPDDMQQGGRGNTSNQTNSNEIDSNTTTDNEV